MVKKKELHPYLIKTVIAAFTLPILTFIILFYMGMDDRINTIVSLGIFIYLMLKISLKTIDAYKHKKKKAKHSQ